jgi:hypothetical protein
MMPRRAAHRIQLIGLAAAGTLIGHWLAYLIAVQNASVRDAILMDTGHSYLTLAVKLAFIATTVAFLSLLSPSRLLSTAFVPTWWTLAVSLGLIQSGAFTAMEITERLVAGVPIAEMMAHGIFLLGIVVQLGLAAGLSLLWRHLRAREIIQICASTVGAVFAGGYVVSRPSDQTFVRARDLLSGREGVRGPPISL